MKQTTKRTEVTIETETIVHQRAAAVQQTLCSRCEAERMLLTLAAASGLAGTSIAEIHRLLDSLMKHLDADAANPRRRPS